MKRRGWNVVSAPIALVAIGRAQLTGTPSRTSAAARFRFSGVMRLIVPSSSSCPQRPQLLRLEIILTTSLSVKVVATGVLLAGPQAGSGLEVFERHRLQLHPEPEVRHEDEVGMRAPRDERVALAEQQLTSLPVAQVRVLIGRGVPTLIERVVARLAAAGDPADDALYQSGHTSSDEHAHLSHGEARE